MMYLKQFPDICREMGFDVEEKEKIVTLCVTDINCSININKKLFLEDLELALDSYSEVCVAIAVFEAKAKAGKYDNLDATELQKLKCVFDKAWEPGGSKMTPVCSRQKWIPAISTPNVSRLFLKSCWKN